MAYSHLNNVYSLSSLQRDYKFRPHFVPKLIHRRSKGIVWENCSNNYSNILYSNDVPSYFFCGFLFISRMWYTQFKPRINIIKLKRNWQFYIDTKHKTLERIRKIWRSGNLWAVNFTVNYRDMKYALFFFIYDALSWANFSIVFFVFFWNLS